MSSVKGGNCAGNMPPFKIQGPLCIMLSPFSHPNFPVSIPTWHANVAAPWDGFLAPIWFGICHCKQHWESPSHTPTCTRVFSSPPFHTAARTYTGRAVLGTWRYSCHCTKRPFQGTLLAPPPLYMLAFPSLWTWTPWRLGLCSIYLYFPNISLDLAHSKDTIGVY